MKIIFQRSVLAVALMAKAERVDCKREEDTNRSQVKWAMEGHRSWALFGSGRLCGLEGGCGLVARCTCDGQQVQKGKSKTLTKTETATEIATATETETVAEAGTEAEDGTETCISAFHFAAVGAARDASLHRERHGAAVEDQLVSGQYEALSLPLHRQKQKQQQQ